MFENKYYLINNGQSILAINFMGHLEPKVIISKNLKNTFILYYRNVNDM